MQSVLICEPRSKTPASANLARHLPTMLKCLEHEWKDGAWATRPERPEHALMRTAHDALGRLLECYESHGV
jgi:hypothetical protein